MGGPLFAFLFFLNHWGLTAGVLFFCYQFELLPITLRYARADTHALMSSLHRMFHNQSILLRVRKLQRSDTT